LSAGFAGKGNTSSRHYISVSADFTSSVSEKSRLQERKSQSC